MKRRKEGQDWYGKISYQDHEEELEDPEKVEAKIREGSSTKPLEQSVLGSSQLTQIFKLQLRMKWLGSELGSAMTSSVWRLLHLTYLT